MKTNSLGFWRCWAVVVGGMIGSGVFLLPAVLAPYGSLSLIGWVVTGGGTLLLAVVLGSLARRIPKIGGPYAYVREAFGDLPGFLIAWGFWISLWSSIGALGAAFIGYLGVLIPVVERPAMSIVAALGVIWLVVGINMAGVKTAGVVQLVTTVLKLLPLLFVAAGGLLLGDVAGVAATNPEDQSLLFLIAGMVMLTMWAFLGVEFVTVPADDVIEPQRTIPRALIAGTLTVTVVYILATFGVMALIPLDTLAASASPFADAASELVGGGGATFVAIGALISILGAMTAAVLVTGMVPRAAALDGLFPQVFARLNRHGAPGVSLAISGALASLLVVLNFTKGLVAAFEFLIVLSTLTTLLPYGASALAKLWLLRRDAVAGHPGGWVPVAVAGGALGFSAFAIIGSGLAVAVYGVLLLAAGLPVYARLARRGTAKPERT